MKTEKDNYLIIIRDLIDKVYEEETNPLNITRLELAMSLLDKL